MTAKEIKDGMTQGVWGLSQVGRVLDVTSEGGKTVCEGHASDMPLKESNINSAAICNAINNTYGQGIDPECVPEMLAMLESLRSHYLALVLEMDSELFDKLDAVINSAKI